MKKKDKANLMKIVIGGLVLVGLYFGYQAMTGGSSPFSMASRSPHINFQRLRGGYPFHGTATTTEIFDSADYCRWSHVPIWRGIIKTGDKSVEVKKVYFRIGLPLTNTRWASTTPFELSNIFLTGPGDLISKGYIESYNQNRQKRVVFVVNQDGRRNGEHIIAPNTKEKWSVSAYVKTRQTSGIGLRLDLASKFEGVTVLTSGVGGVPKNITRMGNTPANSKTKRFICRLRGDVSGQ